MSKIIKSVHMQEAPFVIAVQQFAEPEPSESTENVSEIILHAHEEAEAIIAEARKQAETMMAGSQEKAEKLTHEAEELKQQGYDTGFKEGHQQGQQEGYQQGLQAARDEMQSTIQSAVDKAQQIVVTADKEAKESILAAERELIEIALEVSQKILAREIETNSSGIISIVQAALEKVRDQDEINIRVHPDDYETVLQARHDLQMAVGRGQTLSVSGDQTMEQGSCVIESSNGSIDARISVQFDAIKKALQELLS